MTEQENSSQSIEARVKSQGIGTPPTPETRNIWIRAESLSKYYGDFTAIEDVSFDVMQGSITAFLGPNGAGKSTTLKCLTGFLAPSKGKASILGHDMTIQRIEGVGDWDT